MATASDQDVLTSVALAMHAEHIGNAVEDAIRQVSLADGRHAGGTQRIRRGGGAAGRIYPGRSTSTVSRFVQPGQLPLGVVRE